MGLVLAISQDGREGGPGFPSRNCGVGRGGGTLGPEGDKLLTTYPSVRVSFKVSFLGLQVSVLFQYLCMVSFLYMSVS